MFKKSIFNMQIKTDAGTIVKNLKTGSVINIKNGSLDGMIEKSTDECLKVLNSKTGIVVPTYEDEGLIWHNEFINQKNKLAKSFTLYFVPSLKCQMACSYCFENGTNRSIILNEAKQERLLGWINQYLAKHNEIKIFRFVLFGGEPLLHLDLIHQFTLKLMKLLKLFEKDFFGEILTNGERLNKDAISYLREFEFKRVQITLDGAKEIHDRRRYLAKGKKPTYETILENVSNLLNEGFLSRVSIRVSFDNWTSESVQSLIDDLASRFPADRIELSLGLITPTLSDPKSEIRTKKLAESAVATWSYAKSKGFRIPKDFMVGPWCVAVAKHSVAVQPDGSLHKCFCTSGKHGYSFSDLEDPPAKDCYDPDFEDTSRVKSCIESECPFLPICGGGCYYDGIVRKGQKSGARERFCQKSVIQILNAGLLRLNYGGRDEAELSR